MNLSPQDKIKILQLVSVPWWNASAYYGIILAKALEISGIPTIVAGRGDSPPLLKAKEYTLTTHTEINLETFNPAKTIHNYLNLKQLLKRENILLINSHRPQDHIYGALARRSLSSYIPLIRTVSDVRYPKTNGINYWLHNKATDYFIFTCMKSYERYQSIWPIFENRSAVIYSAIDTDYFQPENAGTNLRKKLNIVDNEIVVGIIARLSPVKDHHTFLKAAALVAEKYPNTRFLISGEEAQLSHADLKELAGNLKIAEKVIFMHRDDSIDIRDLINCLDVGVVASNGSEVICRISVEYMAMEKPQVTTDINVLPEIIEPGKNGFVVPAGDYRAMAKEIIRLVGNKNLRREIGIRARNIAVEKYSFPVLVKKTMAVYKKVLNNAAH